MMMTMVMTVLVGKFCFQATFFFFSIAIECAQC